MEKELTPEELKKQRSKANRDARKARKKLEGNNNIDTSDISEDSIENNLEEGEKLEEDLKEELPIESIKENIKEDIKELKEEKIDQSTLTENKDHLNEPSVLSPMAQKWKAYIQYNKLDLHKFLEKYPRHKF